MRDDVLPKRQDIRHETNDMYDRLGLFDYSK